MPGPLDGIRIVDLTQVQAGPSCTQLFAFLGADVIKIEEPVAGDRTRRQQSVRDDVDSFYFIVFNANKRSLTLNLKSDRGREILLKLVAQADIVVENYGPGQMERFRPRLRCPQTGQPEDRLLHDQGIRNIRPQCTRQELRAHRTGRRRRDERTGRTRT